MPSACGQEISRVREQGAAASRVGSREAPADLDLAGVAEVLEAAVPEETAGRALDEHPEAEAVRRLSGHLALDEGARLGLVPDEPVPM
jgi:hypothetical protein